MTTIPKIEKTEPAKCDVCGCICMRLCAICGNSFCTKHLLSHAEKCTGYNTIVRSILRDDVTQIVKQIVEVMLRSI